MDKDKLTFENTIARIDEITSLLSDGSVPLDKSIELYSEASSLLLQAKEQLQNAKLKVEEITSFIEAGGEDEDL